jgi:hypothetical protein
MDFVSLFIVSVLCSGLFGFEVRCGQAGPVRADVHRHEEAAVLGFGFDGLVDEDPATERLN